MQLINWNSSVALDISEIDDQHKELVNVINEMFDAMADGRGNEIIDDILQRLIDYTEYHFTTEEKYFDQFNYKESEEHKKEHKYFVEKVLEFRQAPDRGMDKLEGSDNVISVDLWKLLKEWLVNHIKNSDRKYARLFKEKGL